MIDQNTTRDELMMALNSDFDLIDAFIRADLDETDISTDDLREFIIRWIEAGDECVAS